MMRRFGYCLRSVLCSLPGVVGGTLTAACCFFLVAGLAPSSSLREKIRRGWARWILLSCFTRLWVRRTSPRDLRQAYLVCANHASYLDPPVLLAALRLPLRFVAKKSLFAIPVFGWAMRLDGNIPLDRSRPRSSRHSLEQAVQLLRSGYSVAIFPEGRRSLDGSLQSLHRGAFYPAIQARVAVLPVAISGTYDALPPGTLCCRGASVRVIIGEPIPTHNLTPRDRGRLAAQTETALRKLLQDPPASPKGASSGGAV